MRLAPHPFSLRQLQYLLAVADTLSFRRAAERCHVSQPSLSAQVAQVEEALGVRLFERDQRRVLVTAAGKELLERARRIVVEADDLVEAGKRAGDPLAGVLRIGVIPTIAPYLLPALTPRLRARFPRLTLRWREATTPILASALAGGELDAALVALESELGDVESEEILKDPFVLAGRRGHPLLNDNAPVQPGELKGAEVLLLDEGHCFREQVLEVCSRTRAHESEFRATSLNTLVQMIAGGAGITLLPSLAVATEAKRAGLRVRPIATSGATRTVALVWRKRSPLAPSLRELASVSRETLPSPLK